MLLVHLYGNASSVVPNRYLVLLCINLNLNQAHGVVSLEIVCSVNKNLIEDLVEPRDVPDLLVDELSGAHVKDPEHLVLVLHAPDIGVGSEQDVLKLCLFLVDFFN